MSLPPTFQQGAEDCGHAEKNCRPPFAKDSRDHVRLGTLSTEDACGPQPQGERETVAESVREEKSRRRKYAIILRDAVHTATGLFYRVNNVTMSVHRSFGSASAARSIK